MSSPPKPPPSPVKRKKSDGAPESSPSRRKVGSSDQTDSSNPSNPFSPKSDRTSRTSRESDAGMSSGASEAQTTAGYYEGLQNNPKLLARSSRSDWQSERPLVTDSFEGGTAPAPKKVFVITDKKLQLAVTPQRRKAVVDIVLNMDPKCCIAVDFIRIGYFDIPSKNPAVILVTVDKKAKCSPNEAQRIVGDIHEVFLNTGYDVEVMEGLRSGFADEDADLEKEDTGPFPLSPPINYPYVGASIALRRDMKVTSGIGTLAGYVEVDGVVYGLTNHHVVLGKDRKEAYPTPAEKQSGTALVVCQPATKDLETLIQILNAKRKRLDEKKQKTNSDNDQIKELTSRIKEYKAYLDEGEASQERGPKAQMGIVHQTSGRRTGSAITTRYRHRMDWALIKLDNPARFKDPKQFVNELPSLDDTVSIRNPIYLRKAMDLMGIKKTIDQFSSHLKRRLTFKEVRAEQDALESNDKVLILWKVGRSTHVTHGVSSEIKSNFVGADGMASQEWLVIDTPAKMWDRRFSDNGDSGSFVWNSDGFVAGLLWGGRAGTQFSFVTPIEAVLDDIKNHCHAKEVKLVVRPEEMNDEPQFKPPKKTPGFKLEETKESYGFDALDISEDAGTGE